MSRPSLLKSFSGRLFFIAVVFLFFLFSVGLGFGAEKLFPDLTLKGFYLLRVFRGFLPGPAQGLGGFLASFFWGAGVILFLFLGSFLFGGGPLFFTLFRGLAAGITLSYIKGNLLAIPLIYPWSLVGTFFLLICAGLFLKNGLASFKKFIGLPVFLKREAGRDLVLLPLLFLFWLLFNIGRLLL